MRLWVHNQVQSRITQMHNRPLTSKITKNALSYERFMQGTRAAARLTPGNHVEARDQDQPTDVMEQLCSDKTKPRRGK